jgi:transcriptional regulator with XRE-family HTH domain
VITNERQYRITKTWLERFQQARAGVEEQGGNLHPRARQALRDQYDSQIEELRGQLAEYEALRRGQVAVLELESLGELPEALIRARAAAGLSQEALAERLGLKKQQVQRYEATRYAGVSLERVQAIADALGAKIREQVMLPVAAGADDDSGTKPAPRPASLAGMLTRAGLTYQDLAGRLQVPPSITLKLQRGRIDPDTVPERLLRGLWEQLGIDPMEARRLIEPRAPAPQRAYARASTREGRGAPRTRGTQDVEAARGAFMPFREALANAPDLTDEHRRAWLEAEGEGG